MGSSIVAALGTCPRSRRLSWARVVALKSNAMDMMAADNFTMRLEFVVIRFFGCRLLVMFFRLPPRRICQPSVHPLQKKSPGKVANQVVQFCCNLARDFLLEGMKGWPPDSRRRTCRRNEETKLEPM